MRFNTARFSLQAVGWSLVLVGAACVVLEMARLSPFSGGLTLSLVLGLPALGAFVLFAARALARPAGIDNDNIFRDAISSRGVAAVLLGVVLTGLYIVVYFGDRIAIGGGDTLHLFFTRHVYRLLDPLAALLGGKSATNWFFYAFVYTLAVLVFSVRMFLKYRHNRYQQIRTVSVTLVQLGFGFLIPKILVLFKQPDHYFTYFWPLKPEYLYPSTWTAYIARGDANAGVAFLCFGALMSFAGSPVLTYFFGKRWYCSWVCGCGALAETAGDPFRQLSDKSLFAWRVERWMIHGVLVAVSAVTILLWLNSVFPGRVFGRLSGPLAEAYGFYIGMIFSGVVGVGFYPLLGSRVWCRFGCPMAAVLGLQQKFFSRFRITTNGAQCISCGNCSTYCEMGIDVKWYAQRGQNIVRSSCVGCGICSAVCPRGVLKLENGPVRGRTARFVANL